MRHDNDIAKGFGLTFLGINLYTRFFELFWNNLHKAVFFAVLRPLFVWFGQTGMIIFIVVLQILGIESGIDHRERLDQM